MGQGLKSACRVVFLNGPFQPATLHPSVGATPQIPETHLEGGRWGSQTEMDDICVSFFGERTKNVFYGGSVKNMQIWVVNEIAVLVSTVLGHCLD